MSFQLRYTQDALDELSALRTFDRNRVATGILTHLTHQPTKESRSRIKKMEQPFWSEYRLRVDEFRVYYQVDQATQTINILHVLSKDTEETPKEMP